MIKVTKNGVPLSAIVSIEICEWRERDWWTKRILFSPAARVSRGSLRLSEAEARELRERFLKEWPEVAALFTKE